MKTTRNRKWPGAGPRGLAWLALLFFCAALRPAAGANAPTLPPLTSVANSPRLPGKFVWADLVTDDVPAARKFYGQLFGWKFSDLGGYAIALNEEHPICG